MKWTWAPRKRHGPRSATAEVARCVRSRLFAYCDVDTRSAFRQKFFGTGFGLTTKVPKDSFKITQGSLKEHISDNGATVLYREFCERCGTGILEYGVSAIQMTILPAG